MKNGIQACSCPCNCSLTIVGVSHIETAMPGAIGRKAAPAPALAPANKQEVVPAEAPAAGAEPERSDSDESMEHEN